MTYQQAVDQFVDQELPECRRVEREYASWSSEAPPDIPLRREAFNDWTDGLCKDGEITEEQYDNWPNPVDDQGLVYPTTAKPHCDRECESCCSVAGTHPSGLCSKCRD